MYKKMKLRFEVLCIVTTDLSHMLSIPDNAISRHQIATIWLHCDVSIHLIVFIVHYSPG